MRFCKYGINTIWKTLLVMGLALFGAGAFADEMPKFNLHYGVTPVSKDIYDLHMTVFWVCVVIGVIVFSILIYSLVMHRKSRGHKPAAFHEHQTLEIAWAIIPMVILVIMAVPATIVLLRMSNADDSALTIKITGYQWKWQYSYLDQGIEYFSNLSTPLDEINNKASKNKWYLLQVDKPLVVPVNEKIRFLITSNDVIHSWWVPALGVKKDAMPGFIHEAWTKIEKAGTYRGQCAELCGVNHGYMPIVVEAVSQKEFDDWVIRERAVEKKQQAEQLDETEKPSSLAQDSAGNSASNAEAVTAAKQLVKESDAEMPLNQKYTAKKYTADTLMIKGQANYNKYCAACHQADGKGIPPIYPALHADSVALGGSITRHIDIILNGVPGTAMQNFAPQLTDFEIASIVTYERNAWDNRTGDVIQPMEVAKQRAKFAKEKAEAVEKQAEEGLKKIKPQKLNQSNNKK
jgi:cytochrome c oxidase subunit 2